MEEEYFKYIYISDKRALRELTECGSQKYEVSLHWKKNPYSNEFTQIVGCFLEFL